MRIAVITLGCKVNQYESDAIAAQFISKGDEVFEDFVPCDIYVINTCAVTKEAERKSRQAVSRALKQNPKADIYIIGCASQKNRLQFENKHVRYVSGTADKLSVCSLPTGGENKEIPSVFEELGSPAVMRDRGYVKIEDGCNNYCAYCVIPYVRGRVRSRSIENIFKESGRLANKVGEIVLVGINVSKYGEDIGVSLVDLVNSLAHVGARFRFSSLEVNVITKELLEAVVNAGNFCPHFHLSLQSGDDEVLKSMNRHYTTAQYKEKVQLIRSYFPMAAITTDIIVGFAGESEEQFQNTLDFAKEIGFANIHIFPYSPRKGTAAYSRPCPDDTVKSQRVARLTELKQQLIKDYVCMFVYREAEVLIEEVGDTFSEGYSENYIRIYIPIVEGIQKGKLYKVTPTAVFKDGLICGS